MIKLSREIRFALTPVNDSKITNSWAAWPSTNCLYPQLALECVVQGLPENETGYVCNIKELDDLLRGIVTREVIPNFQPSTTAESLLASIYDSAVARWKSSAVIRQLKLDLSPFLNFSICTEQESMICLTQQFEFSAAHRLHCDRLSAEENQKIFGKCNNPQGHGHNYVVEVTVAAERSNAEHGQVIPLHQFEATVKRLVIDRLDHKHLNLDIEYFANVNPSVENITIAIWRWLEGQLGNAKLANVRVYETPKTWAEYGGNDQ